MKSWPAKDSSGGREPRTVFRINGTYSVDTESTSSTFQLVLLLCDSAPKTSWLLTGSVRLIKLRNVV